MQTKTKAKGLKTAINNIANRGWNTSLLTNVAQHITNHNETDEEIKCFFKDLFHGGCVSGMISGLVYYRDTNKFYDEHEDEIESLVQTSKQEFGYKSRAEFIASLNGSAENITQEKNLLAWFAFEETAGEIAGELGIDY